MGEIGMRSKHQLGAEVSALPSLHVFHLRAVSVNMLL